MAENETFKPPTNIMHFYHFSLDYDFCFHERHFSQSAVACFTFPKLELCSRKLSFESLHLSTLFALLRKLLCKAEVDP